MRWVSRRLPPGVRHAAVAARVARLPRAGPTSSTRRAWCAAPRSAATLARRPVVVKLVADEAYERARRSGRFTGSLEEFQAWPGERRDRRAATRPAPRRCAAPRTSSFRARTCATSRSAGGSTRPVISVLPNPAPPLPDAAAPASELRRCARRATGPLLAFAGRLTAQKALGDLLEPRSRAVEGASLLLLGDGPEREALERRGGAARASPTRVRFLGGGDARGRPAAVRRRGRGRALARPGRTSRTPCVEALAVGTPVIATAVGGVPEVVVDGDNGLLVPARDVGRARRGAATDRRTTTTSAPASRRGRPVGGAARRGRRCSRGSRTSCSGRWRGEAALLMVGRTRYALPLSAVARSAKFDALGEELDVRVLGQPGRGRRRARPALHARRAGPPAELDGAAFYALLPVAARPGAPTRTGRTRCSSRARRRRRSRCSGRALARVPHEVVVDVHGDPAAATRLYGSPLRRVARAARRRRSRAARSVAPTASGRSPPFTTRLVRDLGVEPAAEFPAFMDLEPFSRPVGRRRSRRGRSSCSSGCSSATRRSTCSPTRGGSWPAGCRTPQLRLVGPRHDDGRAAQRSSPSSRAACAGIRRSPTPDVARALDERDACCCSPRGRRGSARVVVEALLPRTRRRRQPRRRDPRRRRGRRDRAPRPTRGRRRARRRRSSASSPSRALASLARGCGARVRRAVAGHPRGVRAPRARARRRRLRPDAESGGAR